MVPRTIARCLVLAVFLAKAHSFSISAFLSTTSFATRTQTRQTTIHNPISSHSHGRTSTLCKMSLLQNSFMSTITQTPALSVPIYMLITNTIYLLRRSHLRSMQKRKLLKIRLTREDGVSLSLYVKNLAAWQFFVNCMFVILEPLSKVGGYCCFYYFYPNAGGCGLIFEPLNAQHLPMSKRSKKQIRLDYHRFSLNIGNIGRDGYRHPPSIERNLPHIDIPQLQMKHWPWRRRHKV